MTSVAVVAYGAGNTASMMFALERIGARPYLVSDARELAEAERVVLPGVGAAGFAMKRLAALGLIDTLRGLTRPFLGVCLGQQLLFEDSEEAEGVATLGLIPGTVARLSPAPTRPVPHVGWSRLSIKRDDPLVEGIGGEYVYFTHSYACPDGPHSLAHADYGTSIPAVVRTKTFHGCQFHPERSSRAGARLLQNFMRL